MIKSLVSLTKSSSGLSKTFTNVYLNQQLRYSHNTSNSLWKSVLSVSNQGSKKGRGKRRGATSIKDLNRGQELGSGRIKVDYPGLNSNAFDKNTGMSIKVVGVDEDRVERLAELRNKMDRFRRLSIPANERGFTGGTMNGKNIGAPEPTDESDFDGFESRIIEYKVVATVTSILGKKRRLSTLAITGNKNGIIGLGSGKGAMGMAATRLAKKHASQHLIYINRYEDRTIYHNFYKEFYYTKLYAQQMPAGYGLRCHRIIKLICELAGIKDIYVKLEGSTNPLNIAKCFIDGLTSQKTYEDIANEKRLNLVELRPDNHDFPKVLAAPTKAPARKQDELAHEYERDLDLYLFNNRYRMPRQEVLPFYYNQAGYKKYCERRDKSFAQMRSRVERLKLLSDDALAKYQYPARPKPKPKENVEGEEAQA